MSGGGASGSSIRQLSRSRGNLSASRSGTARREGRRISVFMSEMLGVGGYTEALARSTKMPVHGHDVNVLDLRASRSPSVPRDASRTCSIGRKSRSSEVIPIQNVIASAAALHGVGLRLNLWGCPNQKPFQPSSSGAPPVRARSSVLIFSALKERVRLVIVAMSSSRLGGSPLRSAMD